jgi:anti-sigma factor RsiW
MDTQTASIEKDCSQRSELAAYLDGELSPREELDLEMHLAACKSCGEELNEQKKLIQALDCALESDRKIELPANFTRVIVANVESNVSGLRRPQERYKALFVCTALLLLILVGLGSEMKTVFESFVKFADQFLAIGGFVWNLIYAIAVGTAVILRSLSHRVIFSSSISVAALAGFFGVLLLIFSRFALRSDRP